MITQDPYEFQSSIAQIAPLGRLLGVDVGGKYIGIAMSDMHRMIASPYQTYTVQNKALTKAYFTRLCQEFSIVGMVVGWPLTMKGEEGEATKSVLQCITPLAGLVKAIWLIDERLSTKAVTRNMRDAGLKRRERMAQDNHLAATYSLQGGLDRLRLL